MGGTVSIAKCGQYKYSEVREAIRYALTPFGGMERLVKRGDKVLIKPNLLAGRGVDLCVTTHPFIVKGVLELVLAAGGIPAIGDSPAVGGVKRVAEQCGVAKVAREMGVPVVEFNEVAEVKTDAAFTFRRFEIAKAVLEADVVINLPKFKTHAQTLLTLGVKNTFGCIPGMRKAQWHLKAGVDRAYFAGMLTELAEVVAPALTIVDGVMGMEGEGPSNGSPRSLGVIVAGKEVHAVDAACCRIVGLSPGELPTIAAARERGLWDGKLVCVGERIEDVAVSQFILPRSFDIQWGLPAIIKRSLRRFLTPRPVIAQGVCKGCGVCAGVCPPRAISVAAEGVRIDYQRCIRCYCCQEVCPEGAVHFKRGWW